jgi:glycosyltransferase involved in cell wall biosynthesis
MNWRELTGNFLPVDGFVAGYSGHLYSGRGIGLILTLAQRLPEIYFLLIGGEPDDVAELKCIVNERELDNVLITGFIPNSQLPGYQAMCDVLLMPYQKQVSASSGGDIANYLSPLKLFEYLACGRAILSSNLPVLQEILDDTNAHLLDPQDIDNWVQSVVMLKNDPGIRSKLAKKAQQDSRKYAWISRAEKILNGIN